MAEIVAAAKILLTGNWVELLLPTDEAPFGRAIGDRIGQRTFHVVTSIDQIGRFITPGTLLDNLGSSRFFGG